MTEQQIVSRARESQMILESEAFKLAMEGFRQSFIDSLVKIPDEKRFDDDLRRAQMMVKMSYLFEGIFRGFIESGKIAQRNIDKNTLRDESAGMRMLRRVTG